MANPVDIVTKWRGLHLHGSQFSMPDGSLARADNCVITRDDVVDRRKGFDMFLSGLPVAKPMQLFAAGGTLFANINGNLWYYDLGSLQWLKKSGVFGGGFATRGIWISSGNIAYIASGNNVVWAANLTTGDVSILAGTLGVNGYANGVGAAASFVNPQGIWGDNAGNLYVVDGGGFAIRKIVISSALVTTFSGIANTQGIADGAVGVGTYWGPIGIWGDGTNLYIGDTGSIRKVVISTQALSTICGVTNTVGGSDGTGNAARFSGSLGVTGIGANLYVSDGGNTAIRKVVISTGVVTTPIGTLGASGNADGTGAAARFTGIGGQSILIGGDGVGLLYITDTKGVRMATIPGNVVTTPILAANLIATNSAGDTKSSPTVDTVGNIIAAGQAIQSQTAGGVLTTLAGANSGSPVNAVMDSIFYGPDHAGAERRMRAAEFNGSVFVATNRGVVKSSSAGAVIAPAGMPRGLDLTLTLTGASGFLANGMTVSYRIVWGIRDENNNLVIGPPSSRINISNSSGGTRNVSVQTSIPQGITTACFFQVYRSVQIANGIDPGDELAQVYEGNIAAGTTTVTITDITTDTFRGQNLYTNATQEGAAQENNPPPFSRDIATFRDLTIYANCKQKQKRQINLVGVAGFTNGVSTVTVAGIIYVATINGGAAQNRLSYVTGGTDAQNVENTAKQWVYNINNTVTNTTVRAYYISTVGGVPGQILLESINFNDLPWSITVDTVTTGTAFSPAPPVSGTAFSSADSETKNGMYPSKSKQPEHVPIANLIAVGPRTEEIQRVIGLRDSILVFKDSSIWRSSGFSPSSLYTTLLDNTVSLVARDSVAVINNTAFALTNQGVVAVSDSGVQIVSRSIEAKLLSDVRPTIGAATQHDWVGIGHESDRLYILCGPTFTFGDDAGRRICWIYNTITQAWTRWLINANCFAVFKDRLHYGFNSALGYVLRQRSGFVDATALVDATVEMCDEKASFNISSISGLTATGTFTAAMNYAGYQTDIGPGWVIIEPSSGAKFLVTSFAAGIATLNSVTGLTTGVKDCYRPIAVNIETQPRFAANPVTVKEYTEAFAIAETENTDAVSFEFLNATDTKAGQQNTEWQSISPAQSVPVNQGVSDFGLGVNNPKRTIRTEVNSGRAVGGMLAMRLKNSVAFGRFGLKAIGFETRATDSTKVTK